MIEHIEIKKVSTFKITEIIKAINNYSSELTAPTTDNKFKFDLSKQLWFYFYKKVNKIDPPAKHKIKLKVFEAIFLLQIIDNVMLLHPIKEAIDKQLS